MKILEENPPNLEMIELVLGKDPNAIYTYGSTIYNPSGRIITKDVEVHEEVHSKQQGDNPDAYIAKYLQDKEFRFQCELEAYSAQWEFIKENVQDDKLKKWLLEKMSFALSGKEYGNLISYGEAQSKIRNYTL